MEIRDADQSDNDALQALQSRCPQGSSLVVTTVNTPDFFARIKAYPQYRVLVATDQARIVGSTAVGIRPAWLGEQQSRVGYVCQVFVDPAVRRQGIAGALISAAGEYLEDESVPLAYTLILDDNFASRRTFERQGYRHHRGVSMRVLAVRGSVTIEPRGKVRSAQSDDLAAIAALLNETYRGCELAEPHSAESLEQFFQRTPAMAVEDIRVLERDGAIVACVGVQDWSGVTQITVESLGLRLRVLGWLLTTTRVLPRFVHPGEVLKQLTLIRIGFRSRADLAVLVRSINNEAYQRGFSQVCCISESSGTLLKSTRGLIGVDNTMQIYLKDVQAGGIVSDGPLYVDGVDL
ncbi:MAG: GNAT family N-acetyltransferase [Chloroflexota bacterium]